MVVIVGNLVLVAAVILIFPKLGFRFSPAQDQNLVSVTVQAPAGTALPVTKSILNQIEERIRADKSLDGDIKYLQTVVGRNSSGGSGSGDTGTQYGQIQVSLYDRAAPLDKIQFWHKHTAKKPCAMNQMRMSPRKSAKSSRLSPATAAA